MRRSGGRRRRTGALTGRSRPTVARIDLVRGDGATSRLWWATRNEWLGLLDVAGLQLETLHGGFAGEPFTDDSDEYVFVARRR